MDYSPKEWIINCPIMVRYGIDSMTIFTIKHLIVFINKIHREIFETILCIDSNKSFNWGRNEVESLFDKYKICDLNLMCHRLQTEPNTFIKGVVKMNFKL